MPRTIATSENLELTPPANTGVDNSYTIENPAQHANWAALFAAKAPVPGMHYKFKKGDYRGWGNKTFTNADVAGAAGNRIMLRYVGDDEELHPVARKADANEAVFGTLRWNGTTQRSWHTHGLTWRDPTQDPDIIAAVGDIVHDWFLIEDSSRSYGQRIRAGVGNVLQRGVIRNAVAYGTGAGNIGINVIPQSAPVTGTKILNMEVYDWGDSFQVSDNATDMYMATDGLIEDCDFYLTAARINPDGTATAENAMDFKSGSDTVPWLVNRCRMWGFRAGAESTGELVTHHNGSRNTIFSDCTFDDAPFGLHVVAWDADDLPPGGLGIQTPRNIICRRGWFLNIRDYNPDSASGAGSAWRTINNERFEDCVVSKCDAIEYIHTATPHAGGPTYSGIRRITPTLAHHPDTEKQVYTDAGNIVEWLPAAFDTYQRKQWTGIETVAGAASAVLRRPRVTVRL